MKSRWAGGRRRRGLFTSETIASALDFPYYVACIVGDGPGRFRVQGKNALGAGEWSDYRDFDFTPQRVGDMIVGKRRSRNERLDLRSLIWSILRTTFDSLSRVVQAKLPEVKTSSRRNRNNYFPLRAYLEFALPEKQVVISFDVHNEKCGVSVRGDIYVQHDSGDGSSIEDIVDFELGSSEATDERLIRIATGFFSPPPNH